MIGGVVRGPHASCPGTLEVLGNPNLMQDQCVAAWATRAFTICLGTKNYGNCSNKGASCGLLRHGRKGARKP